MTFYDQRGATINDRINPWIDVGLKLITLVLLIFIAGSSLVTAGVLVQNERRAAKAEERLDEWRAKWQEERQKEAWGPGK